MNPTLAAALATLPSHIEWLPGNTATTAEVDIILADSVLTLDVSFMFSHFRLTANISSYGRPHTRVSVGDRPDLLTAWTEVAEVVARVDAAAGAAMSQPRETKADAQEKI